ncbi:MAG: hypothetical protein RIT35_624 [Pseudomonadota bacterium]|jgi:membrane fusion protein (multidrug efflux system)
MIKRMIIMLVVVGIILGGIFGFISFKSRMIKNFISSQGEPVHTVSAMTASYLEWLPKLEAVGTIKASQGVNLSAEVPGIVENIYFKQGDEVKLGMPLLQLRAYDEIAKLEALKATEQLAHITYNRNQAQFLINTISKQTLDIDKANLDVAIANVGQQQALINKKLIRAPFTGKLGIRLVDVGQYLNAGTPISTFQALDTVYVDFYLPQQSLDLLKINQKVTLTTDAYPNKMFSGGLIVINPNIDINTRNVHVRASLNNPTHQLLPGMYVNVKVTTGLVNRTITLPRTTITFNSFGSSVYRIESNGQDEKGKPKFIAKQSLVSTGDTRGDQVAILTGVKEGETIVTSGQIKLRNGSPVTIDNSVHPSNDAMPQLDDQ